MHVLSDGWTQRGQSDPTLQYCNARRVLCIVQLYCAMCSVYCLCAVCCAVMEGHKGDTLGRPRISHSHEYTIATSHLPSTQMHLTHFFHSLLAFILWSLLKSSLKMVTMKNDESGQGLRKYQILDFVTDVPSDQRIQKGFWTCGNWNCYFLVRGEKTVLYITTHLVSLLFVNGKTVMLLI